MARSSMGPTFEEVVSGDVSDTVREVGKEKKEKMKQKKEKYTECIGRGGINKSKEERKERLR